MEQRKIVGVCPPARGAVAARLIQAEAAPAWIVVVEDMAAAEKLAEDIAFFVAKGVSLSEPQVLSFPESMPDSRDMREAFAASGERLKALSSLRAARNVDETFPVVVTTPVALLQPVPGLEVLAATELTLARGQKQPFQDLLEQLRKLDYDSEAVCEAPGQYAVRGGIVDVFPVAAAKPYRLDFFGDEIEEIREFDPVTQRSEARVEKIALSVSPRVRLDPAPGGFADYVPRGARLLLVEPASLAAEFAALEGGAASEPEAQTGIASLLGKCAAVVGLAQLDEPCPLPGPEAAVTAIESESLAEVRRHPAEELLAHERLEAEDAARSEFFVRLAAWKKDSYAILFVAAKEGEEKRMREIVARDKALKGLKIEFVRGNLDEGFRLNVNEPSLARFPDCEGPKAPSDRRTRQGCLVYVTETEVFGRKRPRRPGRSAAIIPARAQIDQLLDFSELVEGDHVVHLQHGIAVFRGLAKIDTAQGPREVVSLEFDEHVTLHVPLSESHLISRYVGLGKTRPQLGKIGSGRWEKTRQAAERATLDLAAEMLQLQARRETRPGLASPPDTEWQREFESSFPFSETPDQLRAIAETKADMERPRPMDRLICGDVGFGKTEVALRAAFKAAQGGRQVAVLVPTTTLAQQHLNTFRERMAAYPVAVEMLSRFRTPAERKRILEAAATGGVDILIGTHSLLQRDVAFKDLGLVVVDEEQRFGVRQKEALKRMRETVDVLSMSATPIPRTLYLALTGARDLSVIETPPASRRPVTTLVKPYEEKTVVDAVRHEIRRGGQVFYLHNRVAMIDAVARRLRELLPGVSIAVGHGQMDSARLERAMTEFVAGRHQVLVCTTIIESGLDIPNCNTIIIEGADRFGLSQLYQLRGRVGRFKHQAYAYLLLHRHVRLLDTARKRLAAVTQHSQPGAGFRIAMRDLELRGAGNLLGSEQSGHIVGVGFELYCQLLRQSVARLRGDKAAAAIRASVKLDFVQPRIPVEYIAETRLRIDFYRRLALAASPGALKEIDAEMKDRFGKPGEEVRSLFLATEIRIRAEQKGIISVETASGRLKCLRNSGRKDDWVMPGSRFPRLTAPTPVLLLREIIAFLNQLPNS